MATQKVFEQMIKSVPDQIIQSIDQTNIKIPKTTKKIIICGMGGSALPGSLLKAFLHNLKTTPEFQVFVHRDYDLPKITITKDTCLFFISYSGNTEETLSGIKLALRKKIKNINVLCAGGKLFEIAKKNKIPYLHIPRGIQPRMALGYFVSALIKILADSGLIKYNLSNLNQAAKKLKTNQTKFQNTGRQLAKKLKNKIPLIYTTNEWKALAYVWKINFNENAKTPAFSNFFPELNHNEMTGFTNLNGKYYIMVLQDSYTHPSNKKRIAIFKKILQNRINVSIINIYPGETFFKMFSAILIANWASYYLALSYNIDPTPVPLVEKFKKLLKE